MVGWHHRLNGHEFEQTPGHGERQGREACCHLCDQEESDTTELNIFQDLKWLNWHSITSTSFVHSDAFQGPCDFTFQDVWLQMGDQTIVIIWVVKIFFVQFLDWRMTNNSRNENQRYQGNISCKDGLDKGKKWYGPNRSRRQIFTTKIIMMV